MTTEATNPSADDGASAEQAALEALETHDWTEALRDVMHRDGRDRVTRLLKELQIQAQKHGAPLPVTSQTPYVNTIPTEHQPPFPGNREIERRIKSVVRWNAMAMVVEANEKVNGIGGHISTYASTATLYEIGFNHFFRGPDHPGGGDLIYFQGHAAPGIYARAYVERRMTPQQLHNFRREFADGGGLASYPHPWLMPDFWQLPTVSMGLSPLMSIYQARFMRYMRDRGLTDETDRKVWAFIGDGETDAPEALGAISLASRERLDNLIWVVNCNLQRLDGPVRGNGSIIQELEAIFRGAGWNVIKVLWGADWDPLLEQDRDGQLARRMGEVCDGEYQKYSVAGGAYIREHFYGVDERLLKMVENKSDDELWRMTLGGHDPEKVYAAYKAAVEHEGSPTVILARTIKGYGLGEAGEGRNITHQQKRLNQQELLHFRDRFDIPLTDEEVVGAPLYRPEPDSVEFQYLTDRRRALGGYLPERRTITCSIRQPEMSLFKELVEGSGEHETATTMAFVRMLSTLMRDDAIGHLIVPIVPDEARTFGMDALFREFRHLLPRRPTVRAGRLRQPALLQGIHGRPDPGGGHHRSGLTVILHRCWHRRRQLRRVYDPVLHLLLHVRLPAGRRPGVGGGRRRRSRLPDRRHLRPHDAGRRGVTAPGRPQPAARLGGPERRQLRPRLRLRDRRDSSARASGECTSSTSG